MKTCVLTARLSSSLGKYLLERKMPGTQAVGREGRLHCITGEEITKEKRTNTKNK